MILRSSLLLCLHWILSTGSLVLALPQLSSPLGPVVNLGYAAFAGNTTSPTGEVDGPVTFFGGIPYAQPPLGDLRFRAPASLNETVVNSGSPPITDARNWGPPCIQQPAQVGIGSEGRYASCYTSVRPLNRVFRLLVAQHMETERCERGR